jgi:histidyl-tRNA synthetase
MSAVGFAVSDVSFFAALEAQGRSVPGVQAEKALVIPFSVDQAEVAGRVARSLRSNGQTVITVVPPYELKKQLTLANRLGATKVIIIAPEELKEGKMIEKDMVTGEQKIVAIPV